MTESGVLKKRKIAMIGDEEIADNRQKSLFEDYPVRMVCFPMHHLHGMAFTSELQAIHPAIVFDLRQFPYFSLPTLDAKKAFRHFELIGAKYIHRPMRTELTDGIGRWQRREEALVLLRLILASEIDEWRPISLLIDNPKDFDALGAVLGGLQLSERQLELSLIN